MSVSAKDSQFGDEDNEEKVQDILDDLYANKYCSGTKQRTALETLKASSAINNSNITMINALLNKGESAIYDSKKEYFSFSVPLRISIFLRIRR